MEIIPPPDDTHERIIKAQIMKGIKHKHRSMFVIMGDKALQQTLKIRRMFSQSLSDHLMSPPPIINILSVSKDGMSSDGRSKDGRDKEVRDEKELHGSLFYPSVRCTHSKLEDVANVVRCSYEDYDQQIVGNRFEMSILQDSECLNPTLLSILHKTVECGGITLLLLKSFSVLSDLCAIATNNVKSPSAALLQSVLTVQEECLVLNDDLKLLLIPSLQQVKEPHSPWFSKLQDFVKNLGLDRDDNIAVEFVDPLILKSRSLSQGIAVVEVLFSVLNRKSSVLIGPRGSGKSHILGCALAAAVASGESVIYITAPFFYKLKVCFKSFTKAIQALNYESDMKVEAKCIKITSLKNQKNQSIQYIEPDDYDKLSEGVLLLIDEAGSIALPTLESLLGCCRVLLATDHEEEDCFSDLKKIYLTYDKECEIDTVLYESAPNQGWWDHENNSLPIDVELKHADELFGEGLQNLGCSGKLSVRCFAANVEQQPRDVRPAFKLYYYNKKKKTEVSTVTSDDFRGITFTNLAVKSSKDITDHAIIDDMATWLGETTEDHNVILMGGDQGFREILKVMRKKNHGVIISLNLNLQRFPEDLEDFCKKYKVNLVDWRTQLLRLPMHKGKKIKKQNPKKVKPCQQESSVVESSVE